MTTPAAGPPGAKPGAKPGSGGKLQRWIQTHKPEAALGVGAVGAAGFALYRRSSGGGGAASDPTTAASIPVSSSVPADGSTAGGITYADPASDPGNYDAIGVAAALTSSLGGLTATDARGFSTLKRLLKKDISTKQKPAKKPAKKPVKKPVKKVVKRPVHRPVKKPVVGKKGKK